MPLTILSVLPFDGAGFNGYGCGCGCGGRCGCGPSSVGLGDAPPAAPAAPDAPNAAAPSTSWTGAQWSVFFQGIGATIKPLLTATGALIDLKSGKTLFPADSATAQLYKQFLEQQKQQQQQQTPEWLWPAVVLGGAAVVALLVAKR